VRGRKATGHATDSVNGPRADFQAGELSREANPLGNISQHDRGDRLVAALTASLRTAKEPLLVEKLAAAIAHIQATRRRYP
jgi:hypothetical protein